MPLVVTALLGVALGATVAATINIPEVDSISEYTPDLVTELLDREGEVFQEYFRENRILLEVGEVPEILQQALVAAEDRFFFSHGGIELLGIARAAFRNYILRRPNPEGASTLTMQLAGTLFLDRSQRTWKRKIAEALRAVELEKRLSKEQILTLYANVVNLGHGNYGFESAARFYFGKSVADLDLAEAALLVAIIPRPSSWSPIRKPDFMTRRRNLVLGRMLAEGYITEAQYQEATSKPLGVVEHRRQRESGAFFAEEVRRYLYQHYGERGLYGSGLKVHTTIDPRIQEEAEESLRWGLQQLDQRRGWRGPLRKIEADELASETLPSWEGLQLEPGAWVEGLVLSSGRRTATVKVGERVFELGSEAIAWTRRSSMASVLSPGDVAWFEVIAAGDQAEEAAADENGDPPASQLGLTLVQEPELEGAVVVIESATGAVRALVGGWDYNRNEFNRATQAHRQVGSAFKPFVFGAAFEQGYTPADTLFDAPAVFAGADNLPSYSPRNFYRRYEGIVTLRHALEKSLNVTAVKLQDLVGIAKVVDFAQRCGIESPLPPYPSLALGSAELTPLELTAAYATFANQGLHVKPYLIDRVETPEGRQLEQHVARTLQATDARTAYLMVSTLMGVAQRGTGASLARFGIQVAGKTGTTDSFTDAWFVGFTPRYAITSWVGYDKKRTLGRGMTGAAAALPIWRRLLEHGLESGWIDREAEFVPPPGIVFRSVEAHTGLLATAAATDVIREAFVTGSEPVQEYQARWQRILELPWYQQRAFYGRPKAGENMPEDIEDWSLVTNVLDDAAEREASGG